MKMVMSPHFDQFSGSDGKRGGFVFMKLCGFPVARRHVLPANPRSADQVLIRGYLTGASQAFGNITDAQRAAWEVLANKMTRRHLGFDYTPPAIAMHNCVNSYGQINSQAITAVAPSELADFSATAIGTVAYVGATTTLSFIVTHTDTTPFGEWAVSITPAMPSAQRHPRRSDYRLAEGVAATSIVTVTSSPQTISLTAPQYAWTDGQYMGIMLMPLSPDYAPGTLYTHFGTIAVT